MSTKLLIGATCTNTYWTSKTIHQCNKPKFSTQKSWKPLSAHLNTHNVIIEKESRKGLRNIAFCSVRARLLNKCFLITHSHTDREIHLLQLFLSEAGRVCTSTALIATACFTALFFAQMMNFSSCHGIRCIFMYCSIFLCIGEAKCISRLFNL